MSGAHRRAHTAPAAGRGGGDLNRQPSSLLSPARSVSLTAEEASFAAVQELASMLDVPSPSSSSWLGAWPFAGGGDDVDAKPPPLPPGTLPEVTLADFGRYLRSVGSQLEAIERGREAETKRGAQPLSTEELAASQGLGLVAAMRDVPAPFFQEGFDLDRPEVWEELVQVEGEEARQASLERLTGFLDTVEAHLVREIAARTDNFFDASGYVQDVRGSVSRLYQQVAALREQMHQLEGETAAAVRTASALRLRRANLAAAQELLGAVDSVAQAQSALAGLLPAGGGGSLIGTDYGGAIDVLEVLQGVLDEEALLGLDCFRSLPGQIAAAGQALDDLMVTDFLDRTRLRGRPAAVEAIVGRLRAQVAAADAAAAPRRRRSSPASSAAPSRQLSEEESAELASLAMETPRDAAAVEALAARIAAAGARSTGDGGGGGGGGGEEGLGEGLLPLVTGLQRMGRLPAALRELREAAAAGLKDLLSQVIEGCLEVLDPEAAGGDASHLLPGRHSAAGGDGEARGAADRLARLPGQDFCWLLEAVLLASALQAEHCAAVGAAVTSALVGAGAALPAAAAAQAAARELADLQAVLGLTDALAALAEVRGGRGAAALRPALQQLCKAALDALHARSLSKLTTLLEQEQWAAVQVPSRFQDIVGQLEERGGTAAASQPGAATGNGTAVGGVSDGTANGAAGEGQLPRKFTITPPERSGEPVAATLAAGGRAFHVVNTQLLLLASFREYLAFRDAVPAFRAEVAQRVLELLKVFNSRTCQLVLGAGAMQVSGLKSITAKHLAVSCQCLSAFVALHPALAAAFCDGLPPPRAAMLAADFARALQDYCIHHEEVCSKLVGIMRERLSLNIKALPAQAAAWPGGAAAAASQPPPSPFAATCAKQLSILSGVLAPLLGQEELHAIFGRIGRMFSATLAEAYELLEPHGAAWEAQLRADMQSLLNCLRKLPMAPEERETNLEALSQLYEQRFLATVSPAVPQAVPQAAPPVGADAQQAPRAQEKLRDSGGAGLPPAAAPASEAAAPAETQPSHASPNEDDAAHLGHGGKGAAADADACATAMAEAAVAVADAAELAPLAEAELSQAAGTVAAPAAAADSDDAAPAESPGVHGMSRPGDEQQPQQPHDDTQEPASAAAPQQQHPEQHSVASISEQQQTDDSERVEQQEQQQRQPPQ